MAIALALGLLAAMPSSFSAAAPLSGGTDPYAASTSQAARLSAVRSIPVEKLSADARAKVASVLSNISVYRRLPVQVIDCDPSLYLFLVEHPDVVVNIWEVLQLSTLKARQTGAGTYRVTEAIGTVADIQFVYRSHDTHIVYAEGAYEGPLFARPLKGRGLFVLKTGYVQETDGRYYITLRLDAFVHVEQAGAEVLAKLLSPVMGKTVDSNFQQTAAFVGSLSRTAETNSRGVERLSAKLMHVQPQYRERLAELAAAIAEKSTVTAAANSPTSTPRVASRTEVVEQTP